MAKTDPVLWERINSYEFDAPDTKFTFVDRVARENGWTGELAGKAIDEYKKFIYLACVSEDPVTPSDAVDQVWHLHMTYTRNYWEQFCKETLKRELHHDPTQGGEDENDKFHAWYDRTKYTYKKEFDSLPPEEIWPLAEIRFQNSENMKRIDVSSFYMIRKKGVFANAILGIFLIPFLCIPIAIISGFLSADFSLSRLFFTGAFIAFAMVVYKAAKEGKQSATGGGNDSIGGTGSLTGCGSGDSGGGGGCGGGGGGD